jgi:hypothetical protein
LLYQSSDLFLQDVASTPSDLLLHELAALQPADLARVADWLAAVVRLLAAPLPRDGGDKVVKP